MSHVAFQNKPDLGTIYLPHLTDQKPEVKEQVTRPNAQEKLTHTQRRVFLWEDNVCELDVNWEGNFLPHWRPQHQFPKLEWVTLSCLLVLTRLGRAKAAPCPKQTQTPKLLEARARAGKSPRPSLLLGTEGPAASLYHPRPSLLRKSKKTRLPPSPYIQPGTSVWD